MSLERLFVITATIACTAMAIAGCEDDPAAPAGDVRTPTCAPVEGKSVEVTVSAGDWTTNVSTHVDPITSDTSTSFSGTASLSGTMIQNVNAGDTLCIRVVFSNPLVISETVPPSIGLSLGGGISGGCQSAASYHTVIDGGDWGVTSDNAGVRNSGSCPNPSSGGAIHGYWHNMVTGNLTEGNTLYCIRTKFQVPAAFGSTAIPSGQTLPVDVVAWSTTLDGDRSANPFPVQTQ